jgi:hypothetical protein
MQPAIKAQEQEQPQLTAGTDRGTSGGDAARASCGWLQSGCASPLELQKERRAPGLLSVRD